MNPERSKILMLSLHGYVAAEPELGKPDTGGQVVFVLELARRFHAAGCRVDVVTRRFADQPEVDSIADGLRVWRIAYGGRSFIRKEDMHEHLEGFVRNFLRRVRGERLVYDVINSHYWDAGWVGVRLGKALGAPHVHTPHSLGLWKQREMNTTHDDLGRPYRFEERITKERRVFRRCDHVIATSRQQLGVLGQGYGVDPERVSLIPPGIDEHRFKPVSRDKTLSIRQQLGMGPGDIYTVGRAAMNKGYDLLIRAMASVRQLCPGARLVLAPGADSVVDRQRIEAWKTLAGELGVSGQLVWRDYIPDSRMADHYRAAGVFALASRYEPFGMTGLEAMACGTPTVLTVHGGLHEVVEFGRHALYADPRCPGEFGSMLGMPLRYPRLRQRLGVEGSKLARRRFGWTGIAQRTLGLFHELIDTGRWSGAGDGGRRGGHR